MPSNRDSIGNEPPKPVAGALLLRPPHAATVIQQRPQHPALVMQPRPAGAVKGERPPHPATVIQQRPVFGAKAERPPHPATVIQQRPASGVKALVGVRSIATAQRALALAPAYVPLDEPCTFKDSADLLKATADHVMATVDAPKPMEVQAGYFAGDNPAWYIASNGAGKYDGVKLQTLVNGLSAKWKVLFSAVHAEQQILRELAKRLANGKPPSYVTIIGTKRPCSVCRRVLLAFWDGLQKAYKTSLHFVDLTGADTVVGDVRLDDLGSNDMLYKKFLDHYGLALKGYSRMKLSGETEASSKRTNASTSVDELQ